jgi:hypothetical protein
MRRTSILSIPTARELLGQLKSSYDKPVSVKLTPGGGAEFTVTARNCSKGNSDGRELTGGVSLSCSVPPTKIRPDWTERKFICLFDRVLWPAVDEFQLDQLRSSAMKTVEDYVADQVDREGSREKIHGWAVDRGINPVYEEMSYQDCVEIINAITGKII